MKKLISIIIIIFLALLKVQAQCTISGELNVCVGSITQLTGSGTPALTDPWFSATPGVATISSAGLVTGVAAGSSLITYTDIVGCSTTATVTVAALVVPTFAAVGPYCSGATIPALPTTSTNGITGTWSPAIDNMATTTYTFTPTAGVCTTTTTLTVTIDGTPSAPTLGTITQPTCAVASGSVILTGLPSGNWTINPGSIAGSTTTYTISGLTAGTYSYNVTNSSGCTSPASANIVINAQPTAPAAAAVNTTQPTCAVATGTIVVTGPLGAYEYNIDGGTYQASVTFTGVAPGSHNILVRRSTDNTCVSSSTPVTINAQPSAPAAATVNTTQPTCSVATGTIVVTAPLGAYQYNIDGGTYQAAVTFSGVAPGSHSILVRSTADNTCISNPSAVIINAQPVTPAAPTLGTITQPTCAVATGSVILTGLPSGNWTINPGSIAGSTTTYTISGLTAGTYSYNVTNASGCTSPASANIVINAQPTAPAAAAVNTTQPTCAVATGTIVVTGPLGAYEYNIDGGTYQASVTFTGVAPGSHNILVRRSTDNTCVSSSTPVTINAQPSAPAAATVNTTQPTCSVATGTIVVTAPLGAYQYNIDGGTYQAAVTFSGVAPGSHSILVRSTADNTCISNPSAVIINAQPVTPAAPTLGTITQPTCAVATGSVILTGLPSGNWTINPGSIAGSTTTYTISGLTAGTYSYNVTNASGCTSPASANIVINAQPTAPAAAAVNTTQPTCAVATGTIVVTGPLGAYEYNIDGGTYQASVTFTGVAPGSHNILVRRSTDNTCVSSSTPVTINAQPSAPAAATVNTTQPTCSVATGTIVVTAPLGAYQYNIDGGTYQAAVTFSGVAPGSHSILVRSTADNTCISNPSAVIINAQPVTPAAPTLGTITQPTCAVATGSVILTGLPSGNWTINPGSIAGSTPTYPISGLTAGTYSYTVTNASGCTSPASANIVINAQPTTPTAPIVGTITQPTCTVATGSVILNGLPSTGTWTLTRTPGGTITTGTGTITTISGLATGSYTYTVTNASGCTSNASANVIINVQPATPIAPAVGTITQPTCAVATGSVILNGLPSTGTWTLTRSPGGTTSTGTGISTTISGLATGTYTYTVTNASGCISPASANVVINVQPTTPTAPSVGTITQPTCTVATGSVILNGLPSTGTWTLTRTPGGTITTGTGTSTTISGLATGSYTYTVTNASGCISPASANVVINVQPTTPTAPSVGTITQPTCTVATGSVILTGLPSGNWTINPGSMAGSTTTYTISGLTAGTFSYTVTNASGCISPASGNVVINVQPTTPTAPSVGTITQPTCTVATGSVILNGLPSTGTWTLTRNPGGTTSTGSGSSITLSGLTANTHTFTVTNSSGCTSLSSGNVIINTQPSTPSAPTVVAINQPTCTVSTGSVQLTGLPSSGTWTATRSPGGATSTGTGTSTTISGLASNTYSFRVTNASGCTSSASDNVDIDTQPPTPAAPSVGTITQPTCTAATGSLVLNGLPSTGTWTVTGSPGGTTGTGTGSTTTISGLSAGTYTFTVTNASGCTSLSSGNGTINVQPVTPIAPVIGTITQPSLSVPTGSVLLNSLPATGTWILTRTPGGIVTSGTGASSTITGLAPGTYSFTVTNASGCTSTASATIGFYTLKLSDPSGKILHPRDTIILNQSDAGAFSITVESNTEWTVSDNSLWFTAIKEVATSSINVTYMENISAIDKVADLRVAYTSNPEMIVSIKQKARVSQLRESKFEYVKMYPNPAADFVYLDLGEEPLGKIIVTLTNIQGYTISTRGYDNTSVNQKIEMDISGIPSGQYFLSIGDKSDHKTFQLIKY